MYAINADQNQRTVVLVEDEHILRAILARYLRARGHVVVEATTASEAREVLASTVVDVLAIDINLPDDTGWSVMRWLRERGDRFPDGRQPCVVVMSAVPPARKRIEEFAPDAVLNKPFPIEALGRLVEHRCLAESAPEVDVA
jgi:two-component system OmpR family response regulator